MVRDRNKCGINDPRAEIVTADLDRPETLDAIKESAIPQIMVSPGSVLETSLSSMKESVKYMRAIYGISGHGKVCLVALKDIAEVTALLMTTDGHEGKNYFSIHHSQINFDLV